MIRIRAPKHLQEIWDEQTRASRLSIGNLQQMNRANAHLKLLLNNVAIARAHRIQIVEARATKQKDVEENARVNLKYALRRRRELVEVLLLDVERDINDKDFRLSVRPGTVDGKRVFQLDNPHLANFFAEKLLQQSLKRAFGVKTTGRDVLVEQLIRTLDNKVEKTLVRADVKDFFESIPHTPLLKTLKNNRHLPRHTISLVEDLLAETNPTGVGLPRGLGISSVLANIYLQVFDAKILNLADTIFYARYVDDMVGVFSHSAPVFKEEGTFLEIFAKELEALSLELSPKEEKKYEASHDSTYQHVLKFTLLGYAITANRDRVSIALSDAKFGRLKRRLESAFDAYFFTLAKTPPKEVVSRAGYILRLRLKFLTSNTRLHNNKKSSHVGVYSSNRHLTDESQLIELDAISADLAMRVTDSKLAAELRNFSFVTGFHDRTFHRWRTRELKLATSLWSKRER